MTFVPPDDASPVISLISPRGNPPPIRASKTASPVGVGGYAVTLLGKDDPNPCCRSKVLRCLSWAEAANVYSLFVLLRHCAKIRPEMQTFERKNLARLRIQQRVFGSDGHPLLLVFVLNFIR